MVGFIELVIVVLTFLLPYLVRDEPLEQTPVVEVHVDEQKIVQQIEELLDERLPEDEPAQEIRPGGR